jgi:hypothetical protein
MNERSQIQLEGKNWILPKEMNANRFFRGSYWMENWKITYVPLWDLMEGAWLRTQFSILTGFPGEIQNRMVPSWPFLLS